MRKESNLCVNGTIFNQATFSCDWWYNVDCPSSAAFYSLNADLGRQPSNEHHRKGTIEFPQLDGDEKKGHHGIVSLSIPPPPPHPSLSISNLPKNIPNSVPNFKQPNFNLEDIPEPPRPRLKKIRPPPPEISQPSSFVEPVSLSILHPPKPGNHDIPPPPLLSKPSEPEILPPPLPPRHRPVPNFEFPSLPRPSHLIGNAPSLPLREMESGKKPDGGSFKFTPGDSQYDRGAFNPAIHLPRRKVISDKKFSRVPDIPHIKPVKSPQMHPVKSGDVISGYSDLYLGKPVDED